MKIEIAHTMGHDYYRGNKSISIMTNRDDGMCWQVLDLKSITQVRQLHKVIGKFLDAIPLNKIVLKKGKDIKALRLRYGLTQEAMACRLGVTFATVNRWENNNCKPSHMAISKITDIFGNLEPPKIPPRAKREVPPLSMKNNKILQRRERVRRVRLSK